MHVLLLLTTGLVAICSGQKHTIPPSSPILCFCPEYCPIITICPYGLELGYSGPCRCCQDCVIPKNGQCPYYVLLPSSTPIDSVSCEDGTKCCNAICTNDVCETDSTTEKN
ncbi:unnamed protein product [Ceutorhynchus assimilis]|uniref:Uncharacterized protein n=1 Tax=Ceutorhynchus assimilis TaxID=467358 RepID=A0A9N9QRY5_9CUCU|nr:unnamed protein product [Ceutorhynchus assimilis]